MWKKIISENDIIVYETQFDGLNIRIEARNSTEGWVIIKRYYALDDNSHSYTEDYYKPNLEEVKETITRIMQELLTKSQIKKIKSMKKNIDISMNRLYNESNVEKWIFTIDSQRSIKREKPIEDGSIIVKFAKAIEVDVMIKEKFKHYEQELIELLNERLGLTSKEDKEVIHNFYYYTESTSYSTKEKDVPVYSMLVK